MRLDVDRLAAREEIERKWDEIEYGVKSRKLRQIQPKEISIQVTAPLFSSRLFEHGAAAGDSELPQALDVGKKIELTYPINFFGENYNTIYILSNGAIGFEANSRSYKAGILPGPTKIIAPFWNRNDLRNGGHVHYREVTRGRVLERGQSEIRYQYDKNVKVKSALIVTWDRMQPLNTAALPEENANTFQAAIFNTDNGTFANFIYSNIGWTQGGESGFSAGDATNHFKLPTSGTPNIMYLEEYGNTGIPGEWMFELSEVRVISCKSGIKGDTCDQECSSGEWGPDCAYCCHCAEGTCHAVSGECNKGCSTCWTGVACQERQEKCSVKTQCATNALSFNDYDRCGEPIQRCQCLNGYKGDGYKQCDDIDECSKNSTICHKNAICTNTPGRYFCQCKEGFTGDGSTECSSTLLFQYDTHQQLPRKKNARVEVTLRHPMKIFGDNVDKLMISSNGLIATSDVADLHAAHLEDMKITGVAPFFSLIDISRSGAVTVEEVDDVELLRRLTRTIAENYNDPGFEARSALVVTFSNVTTARSQSGNTFQTLLIDGTSARNEKQTFAQILYKDVDWTENAEVGILSKDSSSTILLPGSGTEGVRQLAKSSNIKQPGAWLYRIDRAQVQPCAQSIQIPPLCDRLQTSLSTSNNKEARLPKLPAKIPDEKSEDLTLPTPKVFEIDQPIGTIRPSIQQHTSLSFDNDPTTTQLLTQTPKATTRPSKPRPSFSSTPHRPIVSLSDEDFEVGPDAFEVTFPPFINVVPQLQTSRPLPDFSLKTTDVEVSRTTLQTTTQMTTTELTTQSTTAMTSSMTLEADYDVESVPEPSRISLEEERMRLHKVAQMKPEFAEPPQAFGTQKAVPPSSAEMMKEPSRKPPRVEVVAKMPNKEPDVEFADDSEKRNEESNTIFVFSSTTLKPPSRKVTTAQPTTQAPSTDMKSFKNNIVTASPRPNSPEAGNAEEQSDKKLAIILPLSIIGAWLMILLCIATFVCCKKRQSRDAASHLRALYGNNYGVRPTSYEAKRKETSYEDHLERAARLTGQSPLASTQGLGKVSLYGSYWNLQQQHMDTPSTSSHSPSRMSHHSPVGYRHSNIDRGGYPNTRYTYTGHY